MTTDSMLLYWRDEREYRTAVDVLASGRALGTDMIDLRECSRPHGAYTVPLGDAVKAVEAARHAMKHSNRRTRV